MEIDINDPICPSCGFPKVDSTKKDMSDAVVCFYCYHRGDFANSKLFILYVLNEQTKPVTYHELENILNNHPLNNGKHTFTYNSLILRMRYFTRPKNKLILVGKRKGLFVKEQNRQYYRKTYKIGKRKGVKYLERYLKKWDEGLIMHLKGNNTIQKLLQRPENRFKPAAIKKKLRAGEYDRFQFLFIDGLKRQLTEATPV